MHFDDVAAYTERAALEVVVVAFVLDLDELAQDLVPAGLRARILSAGVSGAQISEYTDSSRRRRAISWVYCDPKSRTMIV